MVKHSVRVRPSKKAGTYTQRTPSDYQGAHCTKRYKKINRWPFARGADRTIELSSALAGRNRIQRCLKAQQPCNSHGLFKVARSYDCQSILEDKGFPPLSVKYFQ